MADDVLFQTRSANENADKLIFVITESIDQLSEDVSAQVMRTHEVTKNQIENDLKSQGVLATQQKDVCLLYEDAIFLKKKMFINLVST